MDVSINRIIFKGEDCIEMNAGGYSAIVAQKIGSNVIRLRDTVNNIEIFRYNENDPIDVVRQTPEIWGLPSLYLPNRISGGILKTSDAVYNLPINETNLGNYIHGFLHKREHKIEHLSSDDNCAVAVTSYIYDENDSFFVHFPVSFKALFSFTLSEKGLEYTFTLENLSKSALPINFATHTTINSPFVDGGDEKDIRINIPVLKKLELDDRCLPTEKYVELTSDDLEYKTGSKVPIHKNICNEMFTFGKNSYDGKEFNGIYCTDIKSGHTIINEVDEKFKFFIVWNDGGFNGYFCPEPMTCMINAYNLSLDNEETGYKELSFGEKVEFRQRFYTV